MAWMSGGGRGGVDSDWGGIKEVVVRRGEAGMVIVVLKSGNGGKGTTMVVGW